MPIKEQLRQWILNRISSGELKEGEQILSINKIAKEFKIGRETVRLSLDSLVQQEILKPKQGKGYFIAPRERRMLRVGLFAKVDGVYIRPVYQGLMEELGQSASVLVIDTQALYTPVQSIMENLAYHHSIDRLIIVPPRGSEEDLNREIAPYRRSFRIAWIVRSPVTATDASFIADDFACVTVAMDYFKATAIQTCIYFSRNEEDRSTYTTQRASFRDFQRKKGTAGTFVRNWEDMVPLIKNARTHTSAAPVGILAENDIEAVFLLTRLLANGIKIPSEASLISCDNSPITDLVYPAITTVDIGFRELGRQAALWIKEDLFKNGAAAQRRFVASPVLVKKQTTL